jgi:hypothetical protein
LERNLQTVRAEAADGVIVIVYQISRVVGV